MAHSEKHKQESSGNGTLNFNRSNELTYAGFISGTAMLPSKAPAHRH